MLSVLIRPSRPSGLHALYIACSVEEMKHVHAGAGACAEIDRDRLRCCWQMFRIGGISLVDLCFGEGSMFDVAFHLPNDDPLEGFVI